MAHILHIDDDYSFVQMVKVMLERAGHTVEFALDGQRGMVMALQRQPDLLILDIMMPNLTGYDIVQRIRQDPRTASMRVIVLTARGQLMDKEVAMQSGANGFLTKPVTAQDLLGRVQAVLESPVDAWSATGTLPQSAPARPAAPAGPNIRESATMAPLRDREWVPEVPPVTPSRPGRRLPIGADDLAQPASVPPAREPVITVIGLRGGTGTTTLAVNLAVALRAAGQQIALLDLSAAGGHIPFHMHVKPGHTWGALASLGDLPDPREVRRAIVEDEATGVALLTAPPLGVGEGLSRPAAQNILREMATARDAVVVDADALNDGTLGALQISSAVVVVLTDDPMSLQTTAQLLGLLDKLGISASMVRLALNHVRPVSDIPAETLQKALKRPLAANIPYDPNQIAALRRGVPLVNSHPDSPFAQAVHQLANQFTRSE